ncbi:hypothetical protein D9M68_479740 [compost metagenome]
MSHPTPLQVTQESTGLLLSVDVTLRNAGGNIARLKAMLELAVEEALEIFIRRVQEELGVGVGVDGYSSAACPTLPDSLALEQRSVEASLNAFELLPEHNACVVRVDDVVVTCGRQNGGEDVLPSHHEQLGTIPTHQIKLVGSGNQ